MKHRGPFELGKFTPSDKLKTILARVAIAASQTFHHTGNQPTRAMVSRVDADGTELVWGTVIMGNNIHLDASHLVPPGILMFDTGW